MKITSRAIILSLIVICIFTSCSDDDNENTTPQDLIVSEWTYTASRYIDTFVYAGNPNGNNEYMDELDSCEKQTVFTFNQDNTGKYAFVRTVENSSECITTEAMFTWTKNNDNATYTLTYSNAETQVYKVTFDNNTMTVEWESKDDNHINFDTYTKIK